ncbi:MAG TPA: tryptophan transporter, partial [Chondromyces sp.]|nr:tryptophan transporter [Chondromyces sp.]
STKNVLLVGIVTGMISGLTTTFPGGFLPNLIDKPVTAFVFYLLFLAGSKFSKNIIGAIALTAIGTLVSGLVFLGSASVIAGLPGPFAALFATVVLPAAVVNSIMMLLIYPIVQSILRRSNIAQQA